MKSTKLVATLLLFLCSLSFIGWSKQTDDLPTETKDILTQGQWKVNYYFADQDRTSQLSDYNFQFNPNGTLSCTHNASFCTGTWKVIRNVNGFDLLEMNVGQTNSDLQQLNLTWKITDKNFQLLNMQGQAQSQYQLRIAKN